MQEQVHNILTETIAELSLSAKFKEFAYLNEMDTLGELLKLKTSEMLLLPSMNYHLLQELTAFLEKHNLAHLIKQ